jgi:hypothetical protein
MHCDGNMIKPKHPAIGMNLGPMVVGGFEITTYVKSFMSFGDVKHDCKLSNSDGVCESAKVSSVSTNHLVVGNSLPGNKKITIGKLQLYKMNTVVTVHLRPSISESCGISKSQEKCHERQYTCRSLT